MADDARASRPGISMTGQERVRPGEPLRRGSPFRSSPRSSTRLARGRSRREAEPTRSACAPRTSSRRDDRDRSTRPQRPASCRTPSRAPPPPRPTARSCLCTAACLENTHLDFDPQVPRFQRDAASTRRSSGVLVRHEPAAHLRKRAGGEDGLRPSPCSLRRGRSPRRSDGPRAARGWMPGLAAKRR